MKSIATSRSTERVILICAPRILSILFIMNTWAGTFQSDHFCLQPFKDLSLIRQRAGSRFREALNLCAILDC